MRELHQEPSIKKSTDRSRNRIEDYDAFEESFNDFDELLSSSTPKSFVPSSKNRQRAFHQRAVEAPLLESHPDTTPHARVVFREDTTFWGSDTDSKTGYFYTILWCASSAAYAVLVKMLLNTFPRPFTITTAVLTVQALYSCLKWFALKKRHPRFRKLRQRHVTKLLPAALLHGIGTVLSHYAAAAGPVSMTILMKLLQPRSNPMGSVAVLFFCIYAAATTSSPTTIIQLLYCGAANAFFVSRSRIRISTHRFNGGQNVFEVTCLASLFLMALPGMLLFERHHNSIDMTSFGLMMALGVLYCINNEMAFHYSLLPHSNLWRRWVSYLAAVASVDYHSPPYNHHHWIHVALAMAVFGVARYFAAPQNHQYAAARDRTQSHDSITSMSSLNTMGGSSLLRHTQG